MKIRLIKDWRDAWKFGSVRWALLLGGIAALEPHLPALSAYLPEHWVSMLALAIVVARVTLVLFKPEEIKVGSTD